MANPAKYVTLSELTERLAKRLGFSSQGGGLAHVEPLLHDFLQDSQNQLMDSFNDMLREDLYLDDVTVIGETLYDVEADCDPDRIYDVYIRKNTGDTWTPLTRGIPVQLRDERTRMPSRYEIKYGTSQTAQLELNPIPDAVYQFGYTFNRAVEPFTQDEHRTSIDSDLVFLFALANASEHYGLPNAASIAAQAARKREQLQARANNNIRITRGGSNDTHIERPVNFASQVV